MTTGEYPRRTSDAFTVNRKASQVTLVRPCLPSLYAAGNHTARNNVDCQLSQKKTTKVNVKEWSGQSMSSLVRIAADRGRWAVITVDASADIALGT